MISHPFLSLLAAVQSLAQSASSNRYLLVRGFPWL
jgi:hypothetical protein